MDLVRDEAGRHHLSRRVKPYIAWGAGPRGQAMLFSARCLAALEGAPAPGVAHIQRRFAGASPPAGPELHRRGGGLSPDRIVEMIIEAWTPRRPEPIVFL